MPDKRIARRLNDPGLQPERTSLSWLRTFFVLSGIILIFFRLGLVEDDPILLTGSIILLFSTCSTYAYAYKRSLMDTEFTQLTSKGAVMIKQIIALSVLCSALIFAVSGIFDLITILDQ